LYTYSHNNPISYYDPTGHSIKKIGEMLKFAAATVKGVAKAVVIPKAKKTAKTLKEDWQSGVDELKKGGVVSQGFASYSEGVVGSLSTKVNNILHPVETIKTSLSNWGTAIKENPSNIIPNIYMSSQLANGIVNSGIELKTAIETKDLNSICNMAGRGTVLVAEVGISSFGAKAISGGLAKGATKGANAAAAANSNAITNAMNFSKNVPMIYSKGATAIATISKVKKGISTFNSAMGVVNAVQGVNEIITEGAKYGAEANVKLPQESELNNAVSEWSRMQKSLAPSKKKLDKFNTATVVYDAKTGQYYYGMNKGVKLSGDKLNSKLADILPEKSLNEYPLGNCAEVDAVNQAINNKSNLNDLYMYTIKTTPNGFGMPKPTCENCTYTFEGKVADIFSGNK